MAEREDRVLVTILDTGVDYNHRNLAFKIERPVPQDLLEGWQKRISSLEERKQALQAELDAMNLFQKFWSGGEIESEIDKIEGAISEVKLNLKNNSVGWDFQDDDNTPYDYSDYFFNIWQVFDHGTHVAGIASQESDDISLLPIRYPNRYPASERKQFYDAIELAYKRGSRIVNISLGTKEKKEWEPLSQAMHDHPDMLFITSAGNEGELLNISPHYPAAFDHPNMLVVASVDKNNNLSDFSNYSRTMVDIAAPGEYIESLEPENNRGRKTGTSMTAPYVTRVAAKIKFINPNLTPVQIISIIGDSVTPVDSLRFKVKFGGIVNEKKALELARPTLLHSLSPNLLSLNSAESR